MVGIYTHKGSDDFAGSLASCLLFIVIFALLVTACWHESARAELMKVPLIESGVRCKQTGSEKSFDSGCELYVKLAIAKIRNTKPGNLALQDVMSCFDQRFP